MKLVWLLLMMSNMALASTITCEAKGKFEKVKVKTLFSRSKLLSSSNHSICKTEFENILIPNADEVIIKSCEERRYDRTLTLTLKLTGVSETLTKAELFIKKYDRNNESDFGQKIGNFEFNMDEFFSKTFNTDFQLRKMLFAKRIKVSKVTLKCSQSRF
jgi:hypothetical protein